MRPKLEASHTHWPQKHWPWPLHGSGSLSARQLLDDALSSLHSHRAPRKPG